MLLWSVALLAVSSAPAEAVATELITPEALRGHVRFLASDALEGRGPGTAGDRLAQAYIAAQLEVLGYRPAGPGGRWTQPVELVGLRGSPSSLTFSAGPRRLSLRHGEELVVVSGAQAPLVALERAELVFVGYGIVAPEYGWDDLKGADLKGKVLVVMNSDPEDDPALFGGKARLWYGRWDYKYLMAERVGAAGCLIIHTTASAGYAWKVVQSSWAGEQLHAPQSGRGLAVRGWTTEDAARRLAALGGHELAPLLAAAQRRDFRPVPWGVTLSARWKVSVAKKVTANVLGLLPGSDPRLSQQAVVLTAHHDHLGKKDGASPGEDAIYNGAVDNAGGVAAMLTVARALAHGPRPRRSVLVAAVGAEEHGLLGASWLVEHSPVPLAQLAADINIDGINIWGPTRDVTVVGLGKSSLDDFITELAARQGRVVRAEPLADRGFFYRSDQFSFARAGVPAAYFSSGQDFLGRPPEWGKAQREIWEATRYHQPSDELTDDWDLTGAVLDAQLYYWLALAVANAPELPTWRPGDEFEAARLKSNGVR